MPKPAQTLVLFSFRNHKRGYIEMLFARLQAAATNTNVALHRGSLKDLHVSIHNNKLNVYESLTQQPFSAYDLLYFELWYKAPQQALAAALYADRHKIPFFSRELLRIMPITKVGELAALADNDIPLPETFMSSQRELRSVFKDNPPIDYPLIVKASDGYGGNDNHLIKNYTELVATLEANPKTEYIVQAFIPNDCDYRCLVMGGEIVLVLKRSRDAKADTHLNNTSQGATGEVVALASLPEAARAVVVKAAHVLGREQFAGVDLLIDKNTNQPYVLEVNQTPQIEIGAATDEKMAALLGYMERLTERESA
jgi:glutathione synthase/RimK-type ligase-like ATP-grasp enzyme